MSDSAIPWTVARQAPLSIVFPRQEYWSGLPFPSPWDLPDPGIQPRSPALQVDSLPLSHLGSPTPKVSTIQHIPVSFQRIIVAELLESRMMKFWHMLEMVWESTFSLWLSWTLKEVLVMVSCFLLLRSDSWSENISPINSNVYRRKCTF